MNEEEITAALALCDQATPGPWKALTKEQFYGGDNKWHFYKETENSIFIETARELLPKALLALRELHLGLEDLKKANYKTLSENLALRAVCEAAENATSMFREEGKASLLSIHDLNKSLAAWRSLQPAAGKDEK